MARFIQKAKIRSVTKRRSRVTTDSTHKFPTAENKLACGFKPGIIGTAWVSDITYVKTEQRWLYLTTVIDMGDRKSNWLGVKFYHEGNRNSGSGLQNGVKEQAGNCGTDLSF